VKRDEDVGGRPVFFDRRQPRLARGLREQLQAFAKEGFGAFRLPVVRGCRHHRSQVELIRPALFRVWQPQLDDVLAGRSRD